MGAPPAEQGATIQDSTPTAARTRSSPAPRVLITMASRLTVPVSLRRISPHAPAQHRHAAGRGHGRYPGGPAQSPRIAGAGTAFWLAFLPGDRRTIGMRKACDSVGSLWRIDSLAEQNLGDHSECRPVDEATPADLAEGRDLDPGSFGIADPVRRRPSGV